MSEHEFDMTSRSSLFELFSGCHGISLDRDMADDAATLLQKMQKEFENDFPFRTQILKRFLKIFLIYLTRQFEAEFTMIKQDRETELVHGFISALEKQFREKKMVADYARMLFVTPNYLNEIVKKKTGYSASHYIRQRVVLEAKRMGRYSSSCTKEIAYSLGFLDSAHFSKFFKGAAGVNFSEFRKEMLAVAV